MKEIKCIVCGSSVTKVSKALYQKLVDKDAKGFLCLSCLANELDVEQEDLLEKAEDFRRSGCSLFK